MSYTKDEHFFRERGFGLELGWGKKPALIVIDFIVGFTDPSLPLGGNFAEEIQNTNKILKRMHELSLPVFFTTVSYDDNFIDAGYWVRKMSGIKTLNESSDNVKIDPSLDFQKRDNVLIKKYASSFFGTDLSSRLNSQGVDTLIITGCTTSGCVRATAVDTIQSGFIPIVVSDAVGDRSEAAHNQSLFDLRQKYADVVNTEDVVHAIKKYEGLK